MKLHQTSLLGIVLASTALALGCSDDSGGEVVEPGSGTGGTTTMGTGGAAMGGGSSVGGTGVAGSTADNTTGSAGTGTSNPADTGSCPAAEPENFEECDEALDGLECSYGDTQCTCEIPRRRTHRWVCDGGENDGGENDGAGGADDGGFNP